LYAGGRLSNAEVLTEVGANDCDASANVGDDPRPTSRVPCGSGAGCENVSVVVAVLAPTPSGEYLGTADDDFCKSLSC